MKREGLITKALSGFYYVRPDDAPSSIVQCRARGVFKKKGVTPLVGDRCIFSEEKTGEGTVTEILPRVSQLIRPAVANVDTVILVFSVTDPDLNLQLLDKFLVHTEHAGIKSLICLSKADLPHDEAHVQSAISLYKDIGYPVLLCSTVTGEGMDHLLQLLHGKISVVSGQSGVGKSSLLNALVPGMQLETGEISQRLGRGRHTTRHVELIEMSDQTFIADTPGFSQLDFQQIDPEELGSTFLEFSAYAERCRFRGCLHMEEPSCAVREATEEGSIAKSRYEHYRNFLDDIKNRKRRY